jgi:hypothetical protein
MRMDQTEKVLNHYMHESQRLDVDGEDESQMIMGMMEFIARYPQGH